MNNQSALLPTALLAMLAAGMWYAPATRSTSTPPEPPQAAPNSAAAPAGHDDSSVDALELLADYLGQDVSPKGVVRGVGRAADLLASANGSPDDRLNAARLVADFCALPFTPYAGRYLADVTRIERSLRPQIDEQSQTLPAADRDILRAFISTYEDDTPQKAKLPDYGTERLSRDLQTVDITRLQRDVVDAARRARQLRVRFVIATAPDPIDSYVGWVFDPFLDAFRRAVESQHYVMDRFYLPDWTPARTAQPANTGRLHEQNPGLLLFRQVRDRNALLLVLLVTETPTSGLHLEAFQRAVRFVHDWAPGESIVRLVGPSFSGTVPSLVSAMEQARKSLPISFDVVTGVATAPANRSAIESTGATFGATIHDKQTLNAAAELFLRDRILGRSSNDRANYALLSESNTGFGQAVEDALQVHHDAARTEAEHDERAESIHHALNVHFPMHISRLHAAGQQQQANASQLRPFGMPSMRPLNLDDGRVATDQFPTLWPALAESATELMVNNVLQTISTERVRVVGIVATDSRDTLFLTQQLAQVAPDTVVYGMESDLLYTHPDFATGTRGMLLVTTYPLYNRNQEWSFPGPSAQKREMFYSSVAEGLYNAVVLQLNGAAAGGEQGTERRTRSMSRGAPLLEYAYPLADCAGPCTPPVWVTVVGRDRLWPVRVYGLSELKRGATTASAPGGKQEPPYITGVIPFKTASGESPVDGEPAVYFEAPMWAPGWVSGLTAVLVFLMLLHGLSFVSERVWPWMLRALGLPPATAIPSAFLTFSRPFPPEAQPTGTVKHLAACFAALLAVDLYIACLFWTWMTSSRQQTPTDIVALSIGFVGISASLLLLVYAVLSLVRALVVQEREHVGKCLRGDDRVRRALQTAARILLGGVGAMAVFWYIAALVDVVSSAPAERSFTPAQVNAVLWYERSVQIMSGVSPTLPVLALGLSVYLWGVQGLRRRVTRDDVKLATRLFLADAITLYRPNDDERRRQAFARVFVAVAVLALYALALRGGVLAFEGTAYASMYYWGGLLAELLVATSLVSTAFYWRSVGARLARLDGHPVLNAFSRLPDDLVTPKNLIQTPRLAQIYPLADRARRLAQRGRDSTAARIDVAGTIARQPEFEPVQMDDAAAVWTAFDAESSERATDRWTSSNTWRRSRALVLRLASDLREDWDRRTPRTLPAIAAVAGHGGAVAAAIPAAVPAQTMPRDPVKDLKEEIVALHLALTLREVYAGMAARAVFSLTTVFLLLASHTFFPFEPHRTLVSIAWTNVLIVIGIGSVGLFGLERNNVLRVMSRTKDGDHSRATLIWRLIVFAVVPLLSLMAVAFPEISTTILKWLEPMQKAF